MKRLGVYIKKKPHAIISVPAILCFITFITNLFAALSDGNIDSTEFHQLLATSEGFEAVILVILMLVLKKKKK